MSATVEARRDAAPRLLVINTEANCVELLAADSLERIARLPVRNMPHEAVVNPESRLAYVCISYEDGYYNHYEKASNFLEVIAVDTLEHVRTIDLVDHWGPHGMALSPDLKILYVTCESGGGELVAVDLSSETVVGATAVGAHGPHWMTLLPNGTKAYTANKEDGFVTVVDTASMTATKQIPTPNGTEQIVASPDGSRVFAASQRSPEIYIIDAAEDRVETTVDVTEGPGALALTRDGSRLLFTTFNFPYWTQSPQRGNHGHFQTLDTATLELGPRLEVQAFPLNVTADSTGTTAYVSNYHSETISVIDLESMEVTTTVPVENGPHGLVYFESPVQH